MIQLDFLKDPDKELNILCLGAHSDDIEIGCGGALLRLMDEHPRLNIHWVVFGARGARVAEAQQSAEKFLAGVENKQILIKNFRDGYFPYNGSEIKDEFEGLKDQISPDVVFTHYRKDRHQDHRLLEELTWNTFRNNLVLEYEIPKYDGDMGAPNFYIPFDKTIALKKVQYLNEAFATQRSKYWFTDDTFLGLMRLRGVESRSESGYAEAFYAYKVVL